jgi:hypothetical protein
MTTPPRHQKDESGGNYENCSLGHDKLSPHAFERALAIG